MEVITLGCGQERRLHNWYGKCHGAESPRLYRYEPRRGHRPVGRNYVRALERRTFRGGEQAAFLRILEVQMATRPLQTPQQFEVRFKQLVKRWREETRTVSSTTDRALHPAYQDIIGMGERALPFIFREMRERGGHWFWALRHITHENPVSPDDAGRIQKMTEAWLRWGREHRYL